MVVKELILTVSTLGGMVVLKELILTLSTMAWCGDLVRSDFNSLYLGRMQGDLERTDL